LGDTNAVKRRLAQGEHIVGGVARFKLYVDHISGSILQRPGMLRGGADQINAWQPGEFRR
jgi:hypothetical protein